MAATTPATPATPDTGNGDNGDNGDNGSSGDNTQSCTITPGMAVRKAELTIDGSGASWTEVELINPSSSTTPTSTSTSGS